MTSGTQAVSKPVSVHAVPALFALALGFAIIFVAGHVQAGALHDAAHDVRHATGFPCH
jgi:cobalt transporter subunit CbtB